MKNYEYLKLESLIKTDEHVRMNIAGKLAETASELLENGVSPVTLAEEFANRAGMILTISAVMNGFDKVATSRILKNMTDALIIEMMGHYNEIKENADELRKHK